MASSLMTGVDGVGVVGLLMLLGFMLELVDEASEEAIAAEEMAEIDVISGMESVDVISRLVVVMICVKVVVSMLTVFSRSIVFVFGSV